MVDDYIVTTFALFVARCKTVYSSQTTIHIARANFDTSSSGQIHGSRIIKVREGVICSCTVCRSTYKIILVCRSVDIPRVSLSISIKCEGDQDSDVDKHEDAAEDICTTSLMGMLGSIFNLLESILRRLLSTLLVHF